MRKALIYMVIGAWSLCWHTIALAAEGALTGVVKEKGTGAPLAGANVRLRDLRLGALTDPEGRYRIEDVPEGIYTVTASMVGYRSVKRERIAVRSDEEVVLSFELPLYVHEMGEIIVSATRRPHVLKDVPTNSHVITAEDMERSNAKELDDLLRLLPGVDVDRPAGVVYTTPAISLRGMGGRTSAGRTLVLLDGVPVNDPYRGDVSWNSLSLSDVEQIEVVRGASSALHGSSAMGGVVNLITRAPTEKRHTSARIGYATMNTPSVKLDHGGHLGSLGYTLFGSSLKTDGYIAVPEVARKDYDTKRTMESKSYGGKLVWPFSPVSSVMLNASHYDDDANAGRNCYYGSTNVNRLNLTYKGGRELTTWRVTGYGNIEKMSWTYDTGPNKDKIDYINTHPKRQGGGSAQSTTQLRSWNNLTVGADYRWGKIDTKDQYQQTVRTVRAIGEQQAAGLSVEDEIKLKGLFIATVGARYDRVRTYDGYSRDDKMTPTRTFYEDHTNGSFSPRVGVVCRPNAETTVRAAIGRAFQAPSLYDLYRTWVYSSSTYLSNPELTPEWLTSFEIGIDRTFRDSSVARLTVYRNSAKDFIYSVLVDPDKKIQERQNVGRVSMQGLEAELKLRPVQTLSVFANYTYNISKIEEFPQDAKLEGKYFTYAPKHKSSFGMTFDAPRWGKANWIGRYVGKRFGDDQNTDKSTLDSYVVMDIKLSRQLNRYLTLSLGIDNIVNKIYQEKISYLTPGRIITGEMNLSID